MIERCSLNGISIKGRDVMLGLEKISRRDAEIRKIAINISRSGAGASGWIPIVFRSVVAPLQDLFDF